jgi:hypothetical protein
VSRPVTFDHLRSKKKPITGKVEILLDSEVQNLLDAAQEKVDKATVLAADQSPEHLAALEEAKLEYDEAKSEAEDSVVVFKFRSIGSRAYDDLISAHPITPDQTVKIKEAGGDPVAWNLDSFPPALVNSCMYEPTLTDDQFMEIWKSEEWNGAELMSMFYKCLEINSVVRTANWGKG